MPSISRCPLVLILLIAFSFAACSPQPPAAGPTNSPDDSLIIPHAVTPTPQEVDLNLLAAASLAEPLTEIGELFQSTHPGVTVLFNFAGSQQLAQQISAGEPADVFASANLTQMQVVANAGKIAPGSEQLFASNVLVVIIPSGVNWLTSLNGLANPGVRIVLAAAEVPLGQYSLDFLDQASADPVFGAGYKEAVLANVVSYTEDAKAVLDQVARGKADAGIVYLTDISAASPGEVNRLDIPPALNVTAEYFIAPVKASPFPEAAQALIDFVLSPEGQAILQKYKFTPPE